MLLGQLGQGGVAAAPKVNAAERRGPLSTRCWGCRLKNFGWPKTSHLLDLPTVMVSAASPLVVLLEFTTGGLHHRGEKWLHITRLPCLTATIAISLPGHPCSRLHLQLTQL
jgi:hypothetical protein